MSEERLMVVKYSHQKKVGTKNLKNKGFKNNWRDLGVACILQSDLFEIRIRVQLM